MNIHAGLNLTKFETKIVSEGLNADLYIDKDNGWTSYTKDGKLSAQWENTILATEKGIEVLAW